MPVTIKSVDNLKGIDIRVEADGFNPQQRNVNQKKSPHVREAFQLKPIEKETTDRSQSSEERFIAETDEGSQAKSTSEREAERL